MTDRQMINAYVRDTHKAAGIPPEGWGNYPIGDPMQVARLENCLKNALRHSLGGQLP